MKALLLIPPTGLYMRDERCQAPVKTRVAEPARAPMDLALSAACLEKIGIECRLKDYPMEQANWETVAAELTAFSPDLLIVTTTTPTINDDLKICDLAKSIKPEIITIAKGAHFLVFDEKIMKEFGNLDVVIRGEPELTIQELAQSKDFSQIKGITYRKNGKIIRNEPRPFLENIDELPFPARHLLNNKLYQMPDTNEPLAFILTSRGCPKHCLFCAAPLVSGNKVRLRSISLVIAEIEECVRKYGYRNFFFQADTFTWDKKWVLELCREISNKKLMISWATNSRVDTIDEERLQWMKRAGCRIIGFGIESGSQYMLDKMKKDISLAQIEQAIGWCKKYGLQSFLVSIVGLPWETRATLQETKQFIAKIDPSFIEINIAYPFPGTEFYRLAKDNSLFDEKMLPGHNYSRPVIRSQALTTAELIDFRKAVLREFYFRPNYIIKKLLAAESLKVKINYLRYGLKLVGNLLSRS